MSTLTLRVAGQREQHVAHRHVGDDDAVGFLGRARHGRRRHRQLGDGGRVLPVCPAIGLEVLGRRIELLDGAAAGREHGQRRSD